MDCTYSYFMNAKSNLTFCEHCTWLNEYNSQSWISSNYKRQCSIRQINYSHVSGTREAKRHVAHCTFKKFSIVIGMGFCLVNSAGRQKYNIYPAVGN